jgi:hypothetical protein
LIVAENCLSSDTVTAMSSNGFIKIHRSILKWEWYTDANTMRLFFHCLLMANHEDNRFRGKLIERGSFQTSYQMLSDQTGMSIQNIRTSLNKLILTGELTYKSTTQNGLITINNYDEYQSTNTPTNKQVTSDQQATNKQLTTNKNLKNLKNDKNIKPIGVALQDIIEAYTDNPDLRASLNEFVQHRNATAKTKLTELALTKNLKELDNLFSDDKDKIKSIDQTIANNWKGVFPLKNQVSKEDKITYTWQEELKAEQDAYDNQEYKPKRSPEEAKKKLEEL